MTVWTGFRDVIKGGTAVHRGVFTTPHLRRGGEGKISGIWEEQSLGEYHLLRVSLEGCRQPTASRSWEGAKELSTLTSLHWPTPTHSLATVAEVVTGQPLGAQSRVGRCAQWTWRGNGKYKPAR